jgi:hypothetical protein
MPVTSLQDIAHYPADPPRAESEGDRLAPPPGTPIAPVTVASADPRGDIWVGGPNGAARCEAGRWRCFWGRRWLPANSVHEIRHHSGDAYLRTDAGWSRIERRPMTLGEKAAHYQQLTEARHTRRGYVAKCVLTPDCDPTHAHRAVDNDGLWTALYCAAQAFRFAASGDPAAKAQADRSMAALLELERLTGVPGFPARSAVRADETHVIRTEGEWHASPVEPGTDWKGDTSSDELSGHFFAGCVYSRLAADDEQKRRVGETCGRILDHLLENGLRLIDVDGQPTRWADFSPESLNGDPAWDHERGLNSLCILSFLTVGHHLTGRERYLRAYSDLAHGHGYLENAVTQKVLPPREVNHSDDQLAFLAYYCLLHLLPAGADRDRLAQGLMDSMEIERAERCPLYNLIAASLHPDPTAVADAVGTLEEWPWDLRDWECRNSHRLDVTYDDVPDRFGRRQLTTVLSPAERPVYRWNCNPYVADGGGDGSTEEDGAAWLLAYWLGRHHGLLPP